MIDSCIALTGNPVTGLLLWATAYGIVAIGLIGTIACSLNRLIHSRLSAQDGPDCGSD